MYSIFIKGLIGDVFSTGMVEIEQIVHAKFKSDGKIIQYPEWNTTANTIVSMYRKGLIKYVIVGGHSLGAVSAVKLANELVKNGVEVRGLILFDYVWTFSNMIAKLFNRELRIDPRIKHSVHFMSKDARVENIDGPISEPRYHLSHIQLDNDRKVQDKVIQYIKEWV